jgi:antitoxin component of RelBE/YafQ-DinJ toxin-antitoxin module
MGNHFKKLADKLKAVQELKLLGINSDQAVDIVFESIAENEHIQFMQEVFKIAYLYGQMHEHNKKSADYQTSDKSALMECIQECTRLIKH